MELLLDMVDIRMLADEKEVVRYRMQSEETKKAIMSALQNNKLSTEVLTIAYCLK